MSNKFNIKDLFQKRFGKRHSRSYDKRLIHPVREWLLELAVFSLVIAVGSALSVRDFLRYQNITVEGGVFQGSVVPLNEQQISKALDIYAQKADAYLKLQETAPVLNVNIQNAVGGISTTSSAQNSSTTDEAVSTSSPILSQ